MANLHESQNYEAGIYQLETTDPVVAGPGGISNVQAKQLANRTAWLKQQIDQLIAEMGGLGIDDVAGLQPALNGKLGLTAKAADSKLLDGQGGNVYAPPGAVISFAGSSAPTGWLECNGAPLSRTVYADLFAAIGTTYGEGNGSTTFSLPDFRGEFLRGWDNGRGVDGGRILGSFQDESFQLHGHDFGVGKAGVQYPQKRTSHISFHTHPAPGATSTRAFVNGLHKPFYDRNTYSDTGVGILTSGGSETRPRNKAVLFCIKY